MPELFQAEHLLKIFEDRYIATSTTTGQNEMLEYFMPSVLGILPIKELMKQRSELLKHVTPLLLHFDDNMSHCGVFRCLQVYLLGEKKWELICKDKRKQNIAKFSVPDYSSSITLIDLISHFEIHIEQDADCKLFHEVPIVIYEGIFAAYEKLKMECTSIKSAFICRCGDHPAVVKCDSMCCTVNQERSSKLGPEHKVWFSYLKGEIKTMIFSFVHGWP